MRLGPDGRRSLAALVLAVLLGAVVVAGVVGVALRAPEPPPIEHPRVAGPRLAARLLLVVVDGLRHDVATDPARMPRFARAMRDEASGELWAGRVSMTSAAVLALGTGQRGGFEQIVRNLAPRAPPHESWIGLARRAGLTVMSVGDPAWPEMYGRDLAAHRVDPEGVAIDVDFNAKTFADARELRARRPDVLIVHFVTPDHQAHAHGVTSRRYAEHVRGFDGELFRFLDEAGPDVTVVVLGDHGAADSGTHGADLPVQRRSVLFALGPGIARGAKLGVVDQVDLAGTFAALLGLPTPAHSRGHLRTDLLALGPEQALALACADAARARALARAAGPGIDARCGSLAEARAAAAELDRRLERAGGVPAPWLVGLVALLGLLTARVVSGAGRWRELLAASGVLALGILLTWGVERLPGSTPRAVRVALFVLGNLPALVLLVVPGRFATLAARAPWLALALVPGLLVATYTTNAQPEAYVAVVVGSVLFVFVGGVDAGRPTLLGARRVLSGGHLLVLAVCLLALVLPGTRASEVYPDFLRRDGRLVLAVALALVVVTAIVCSPPTRRSLAWVVLLPAAALVARRFVPPWPGRALVVACGAAALVHALRGRRPLALVLGLTTYAWVSRDAEILTLTATLLVADGVGAAVARHRAPLGPGQLMLVAAFLFGLAFVQRVGIQGALDLGALDLGVASFGDPHVPGWVVGGGLGLKYLVGLWLLLGAFASRLGSEPARRVLRVVFLAFLARSVGLTEMFLVAGASYWTGLRVLGDLPFSLLWLVASGLAWTWASLRAPGLRAPARSALGPEAPGRPLELGGT